MTTSTFPDSRAGAHGRDSLDDRMEQIRELLYGEFKRDSDARLALLEARVRELESGMHRKLDVIQARLESLATEIKGQRSQSFEDLAAGVDQLGQRIRDLSQR